MTIHANYQTCLLAATQATASEQQTSVVFDKILNLTHLCAAPQVTSTKCQINVVKNMKPELLISFRITSFTSIAAHQATATRRQTTVVKALENRVRRGEAAPEVLASEQSALAAMTEQLTDMTAEFRTLYRG